jgi:hypothetical protein
MNGVTSIAPLQAQVLLKDLDNAIRLQMVVVAVVFKLKKRKSYQYV